MKTDNSENKYPRLVAATLISAAVLMTAMYINDRPKYPSQHKYSTGNSEVVEVVEVVKEREPRVLSTNMGSFREIQNIGIFYHIQAKNPVVVMAEILVEQEKTTNGFRATINCRTGVVQVVVGLTFNGFEVGYRPSQMVGTYGYDEILPANIHDYLCQ